MKTTFRYTKEVEFAIENSIVMFNNTHPHYGITQIYTTRIVLNINLEKFKTNDNDEKNFESR